mgnify:CR=1 FL=1
MFGQPWQSEAGKTLNLLLPEIFLGKKHELLVDPLTAHAEC